MADSTSIRRATSRDLDALLVLGSEYAAADGHGFDVAVARRGFEPLLGSDDLGVILVAETAEELIGYAVVTWGWSIEIGGLDVVLDEIYVRRRGRGVGGRLLDEIETACRARDVKRIFLETERPNDAARRLYARHGWTEDDSIWMSKELT
jgi:ribosomal protein S18 acetylase RimI-like enzyme